MQPTNHDLRESVRRQYAEIAKTNDRCCGPDCCRTAASKSDSFNMIGDAYSGVDGYFADADMGLGCGLPVEHAGLKSGQTVLDLGSGAGLDSFVARRETGETGHIIGVDMTAEMIARARSNAQSLGFGNVEFRLGEIEHLPVDPASIDAVISNCVLNLVPDKERAFAEIYRVLKPGGHFCISDIVASQALPDWTRSVAELYAGCVTGALPKAEYLSVISRAGFEDVIIQTERRIDIPGDVIAKFASASQVEDARSSDLHVMSITVTARKPGSASS